MSRAKTHGWHTRFPTYLKEAREEQGLESQQSLADDLKMPRAFIGLWESGVCLPNRANYGVLKARFPESELYPEWIIQIIATGTGEKS